MKKLLLAALIASGSMIHAYTITSKFGTLELTHEDVSLPIEIFGIYNLDFNISIDQSQQKPGGIYAKVDRIIGGQTVSSYTGFFRFGYPVGFWFPDGNRGPTLTFNES